MSLDDEKETMNFLKTSGEWNWLGSNEETYL